ncbi:MAG: NUDIX domain-containing protein [Bacteroidia bacterium]|nr:NUDIX domain-containing protein [Bacteroidia bacterium]
MKNFNVRVYGILIHENQLLVSDEFIKGMNITKLPGGGLEYGEGTIDCVIREFKEELNLNIKVVSHFYTTDIFVNSAFSQNNQVISIYYIVKPQLIEDLDTLNSLLKTKPFDFDKKKEGAQALRWIELKNISENDFTFIIDKRVAEMLKLNF